MHADTDAVSRIVRYLGLLLSEPMAALLGVVGGTGCTLFRGKLLRILAMSAWNWDAKRLATVPASLSLVESSSSTRSGTTFEATLLVLIAARLSSRFRRFCIVVTTVTVEMMRMRRIQHSEYQRA
jgi:hypothetical protein